MSFKLNKRNSEQRFIGLEPQFANDANEWHLPKLPKAPSGDKRDIFKSL